MRTFHWLKSLRQHLRWHRAVKPRGGRRLHSQGEVLSPIERLEDRTLLSGTAELLRDINTQAITTGSDPANLIDINGTLFFTATTATTGIELWKSDGTAAGTVIVKDIFAGSNGADPSFLTNVGGTLFFRANDGTTGTELWKSDGTASGTVLVKDIAAGLGASNLDNLTNVGGTLFFQANDGITGRELWKSDGTATGTVLVKDIVAGSGNSVPKFLTNAGGTLFFQATDGGNGYELWKSDGTAGGTVQVKDIRAGSSGSTPKFLTNSGGTLFFQATDGSTGYELWKSDGTTAGTVLVKDIFTGSGSSFPRYLANVGGTLFFGAVGDGGTGIELWKSDGTATGTVLVKDIRTGTNQSSNPHYLTNVGGTLFFQAGDAIAGYELWKSDGTATGTVLVKDIRVGGDSRLRYLTSVGGTLFFRANDGSTGYELWKSDGTTAGTVLLKDIFAGTNDSSSNNLANGGGTLFFAANNGSAGSELWKSDGTAAGTVLVKDIRAGSSGSFLGFLTIVGETLFFAADDGINGRELWKSDGTAAGTALVKDIRAGSSTSNLRYLTNVGGTLFFSANDGTNGYELWKSDGTAAGTVLVKDIRAGSNNSYPSNLKNVGGTLFFSANDGSNGSELWKSDGTAAGTVLVKDIRAGSNTSFPNSFTTVGGTLFFNANDGSTGYELWKSDGTAAGTVLVKDIRAGSSRSNPTYLTNVGGTLFFKASEGINGYELWKSDGTAAGTVLVKDIRTGSADSNPRYLTSVGGTLFFAAADGVNGLELWKSDGTAAGTVLVKDILAGNGNTGPRFLTNVGGTLFFTANDGVSGTELWSSDGTAAGTVLAADIANPGESNPSALIEIGGRLFFSATDDAHGQELWVFGFNQPPVITSSATSSVAENTTAVLTVTATDADVPAQTVTFSITGGADQSKFSITSGGVLTFVAAPDFETPTDADTNNVYVVQVTANDGNGGMTAQTLSVTINDVDEFDVSTPVDNNGAANAVNENATNGTAVGITAFASDADGTTNSVTYTLTNSAGGKFAIHPTTGVVTVAGAINREADGSSLSITVLATSSDGSTASQSLNVAVNDVNEFNPTVTGGPLSVDENSANTTAVGSVSGDDADATDGGLSYSITAGNTLGIFAIDSGTGAIKVTDNTNLDRETVSSVVLTVQISDNGPGSARTATTSVTINVNDVNEFDPTISGGPFSVAENSANTTAVGSVSGDDTDATDGGLSYSITGGNTLGIFAIDPGTGAITVLSNTNLNHATVTSVLLSVRISDNGPGAARTGTTDVTINVIEAVNLSVSASTGTEAGQTQITVTATNASAVSGDQTVNLVVTGTGLTTGDYSLTDGDTAAGIQIKILNGQTTGTVTFTIIDDLLSEGTETALLTISNPSAGITLGTTTTQAITITDNDTSNITISDVTAAESGTFTFTVSLSNAASQPITVDFTTTDGTALPGSDYTAQTGTLTFAAGQTSQTVTVTVADDALVEANETFTVDLSNALFNGAADASRAAITDAAGLGTIQNNDIALLTASIVGNDLVIEDIDGTGKNNVLSLSRSGAILVISDANEQFATAISGAVVSNDNKTFSISATNLATAMGGSGKIIIKGQGGSDSLSVNVSTDLGFDVDFQGGSGASDSLTLATDTVTSVTHTFTNANDGSVTIVDGGTRAISYTGLEPITDNLIATDRVFTFNGGAETIVVTDGTASDGKTMIDSTLSESVYFANPTGSLTINAGTGADTVTITSVDAAFNVDLTINGDAASDTVSLNGDITFASGKSLMVIAETLNTGASADLTTSGAGAITITADVVALNDTSTLVSASTVTLKQQTNDRAITLGTEVSGQLSLTDAELDRITADTLKIGDSGSGTITVSAAIANTTIVNFVLTTGGNNSLRFSGAGSLDANGGDVTIVLNPAGSGGVVSGTAATDILADDLTIITGSAGIGASGNPLTMSVTSLTTDTNDATDGAQFLSELNSLTITANDLDAGTAAITLNGGTFLTTASGLILSPVTVASGATLGGTGTTGAVTVQSGGTVAPGASPGILNTGNVTLASGSNFNIELNETTLGTQYDQLNVTGAVTLNDANLNITLGFTPANGDLFTIINNDGTDAIQGLATFQVGGVSIPDGGMFNVGTALFVIDYTGGSNNNDVTLLARVNLPPTAVALTNTTSSLPENSSTASNVKVADINITDDGLGTNTLSLSGADASAFVIVGNALFVKSGTSLNRATQSTYSVTVNVDDTSVGSTPDASVAFTLTITVANEAPTVANAIPDQSTMATVAFTFAFAANTFADVDVGDALTLTAKKSDGSALPSWLTFTAATRTFSGTPASTNAGTLSITVTATDRGGLTASDTFLVVVAPVGALDYGDAPDASNGTAAGNYQTRLSDNGPRHVVTGPRLGLLRDFETNAQQNVTATGDDLAGTDDEDGFISLTNFGPGSIATLVVAVSGGNAKLDAFIDYNANGDFEPGSRITVATGTPVVVGNNTLTFTVPTITSPAIGTLPKSMILRLRLSTAGGLAATGVAANGEVEDYFVTLRPSLSVGNATVTEGISGSTNATFQVSLSHRSTESISVSFATSDGTAVAGSDYVATSGTLTFAPGEMTKTITVPVTGDAIDEDNETFFVTLSGPVNAALLTSRGLGTITDDDAPPAVSIANVTVDEASPNAVLNVTLSSPSGKLVTLKYDTTDGTAKTANGDYSRSTGSLTFNPGETSKTISVPILNDTLDEPNETFQVMLSSLVNATATVTTATATVTIADNDAAPSVSIDDVTVFEGEAATQAVFEVLLSEASAFTVTVLYSTAPNTALAGSDFTAVTSGTITFTPGQTRKTISVTVPVDNINEADETFFVNLGTPRNATLANSQGIATILDNDPLPILAIYSESVTESNSGTLNMTFTLLLYDRSSNLLIASSLPVTVHYATADETAVAGTDYNSVSGTVTFNPGQTSQTINIPVRGDTLDEADETFLVLLDDPINAQIIVPESVGTINDDDAPPVLRLRDIDLGTFTVSEDVGNAVLKEVKLSQASGRTVTVNYFAADSGAVAGKDFVRTRGTLTFEPGQMTKSILVPIIDDSLDEDSEFLHINLSGPTFATLDKDNSQFGFVKILDNDAPPSLTINDVTVSEGTGSTLTAVFTVTLSAASGQAINVNFATVNGTAFSGSDYVRTTGTLRFNPGETTKTIRVRLNRDAIAEADETFSLQLSNPFNAVFGDAVALATILNDD